MCHNAQIEKFPLATAMCRGVSLKKGALTLPSLHREKIVTVYDGNSDGIIAVYRHYPYHIPSLFLEGNLSVKYPSVPLSFMI